MKYKVGDKVKIRDDLEIGKQYGAYWLFNEMISYKGQIVTIQSIYYEGYGIKGSKWTFSDEMIECKVEDTKIQNTEIQDMVNHPKHYSKSKYEPIEVIWDWKLDFNLGSAIKYIARAKYKENELQDLKKARWYLDDEIKRLENNNEI